MSIRINEFGEARKTLEQDISLEARTTSMDRINFKYQRYYNAFFLVVHFRGTADESNCVSQLKGYGGVQVHLGCGGRPLILELDLASSSTIGKSIPIIELTNSHVQRSEWQRGKRL
jgi:hypothetical protein